MNLKVKYDELNDIGNFIANKENELETKIIEISKLIPQIEAAWKGNDSTIFVPKLKSCISKIEIENEKIKVLSELIKVSSKVYSKKDLEWQLDMKKDGINYER